MEEAGVLTDLEVSLADVFQVGETHMPMTQKGQGDTAKLVMRLSIALGEVYADLQLLWATKT